jgi:hypothetical protein
MEVLALEIRATGEAAVTAAYSPPTRITGLEVHVVQFGGGSRPGFGTQSGWIQGRKDRDDTLDRGRLQLVGRYQPGQVGMCCTCGDHITVAKVLPLRRVIRSAHSANRQEDSHTRKFANPMERQ